MVVVSAPEISPCIVEVILIRTACFGIDPKVVFIGKIAGIWHHLFACPGFSLVVRISYCLPTIANIANIPTAISTNTGSRIAIVITSCATDGTIKCFSKIESI